MLEHGSVIIGELARFSSAWQTAWRFGGAGETAQRFIGA